MPKARPAKPLGLYLTRRRVYSTQWKDIYEVIDSAGTGRYKVMLTGPVTGVCGCRRGDFGEPCRHLVLVIMRRGGPDGRGVDTDAARRVAGRQAEAPATDEG